MICIYNIFVDVNRELAVGAGVPLSWSLCKTCECKVCMFIWTRSRGACQAGLISDNPKD